MKIDLSQFRETFLQESAEHIADIESGLLHMGSAGADDETLNSIFRAAHSIKGGAGAFGLTEVVSFTHVLENFFDRMREHQIEVSAELITLLLRANDVLKELIASGDGTAPPGTAEVQRALEIASSLSADNRSPLMGVGNNPEVKAGQPGRATGEIHYQVAFRPASDIFAFGSDPLLLLRNLVGLGRLVSIEIDTECLPTLAATQTDASYFGWQVELISSSPRTELEEIFEFVLDCSTILITEKSCDIVPAAATPQVRERTGENAAGRSTTGRSENSSVRVPTEKIDQLIDLVGEMVIAHSITTRLVENLTTDTITALQESIASLERHIRELHERTMSVRMLPLGSLFSRFHRLVHDLSEKTGKQIRLTTEGDETEVDRGILELLGDPLTHVLRNSADHGIETPAERIKAGKSPEGSILLRASHAAGKILIEVLDDGAGLNLQRIREKAVVRKLISADATLSEEQTRLLIFEPGFSTKEEVSDLSGRGVGMDVVRRNVASLNGSISLDSREGVGTHIKIQLPLTLAIMEGLIVRVGTHSFVVPLISILETVCLENNQIHNVAGQGEIVLVRDEAIPFLRLKRLFGLSSSIENGENVVGERKLIIVVEHSDQRAALEIDELLGQQQIVVKSLERNFTKLDGTLGATILGDGKATLILDAQTLIAGRSKSQALLNGKKARMSLVA
jgi:two-component system chemotaxis sensor kinase CheA